MTDDILSKGVIGALALLTIVLQIYLNWRKEHQTTEDIKNASKNTMTSSLQTLAAIGTPMNALYVDQANELFKWTEKLCASMERLSVACDRHLEETRRAALASERAAEEVRRLQGVIEKAADEAEDRAADARRKVR
jgi:hypothetical protein